jgi:hypothetical protein
MVEIVSLPSVGAILFVERSAVPPPRPILFVLSEKLLTDLSAPRSMAEN